MCNETREPVGTMRTFPTGATRNVDEDEFDFEGFLSPFVLKAYAKYMHKHRLQADGTRRDSDNWQKGIAFDSYMKSGWRHFLDWWGEHRRIGSRHGLEEALCGLLFNVMGYLHELEKNKHTREEFIGKELMDMARADINADGGYEMPNDVAFAVQRMLQKQLDETAQNLVENLKEEKRKAAIENITHGGKEKC